MVPKPANNELQRTSDGTAAGSPLNSVFGRRYGRQRVALRLAHSSRRQPIGCSWAESCRGTGVIGRACRPARVGEPAVCAVAELAGALAFGAGSFGACETAFSQ